MINKTDHQYFTEANETIQVSPDGLVGSFLPLAQVFHENHADSVAHCYGDSCLAPAMAYRYGRPSDVAHHGGRCADSCLPRLVRPCGTHHHELIDVPTSCRGSLRTTRQAKLQPQFD